MLDTQILSEFLNLGKDWHVASYEIDRPSNRLDITILHGPEKKKSFFSRSNSDENIQTVTLRHLPIAGLRTFIHVPAPGSVDTDKVWTNAGSKLTIEMEAFLVEVLNNATSTTSAAKIAGVTPTDARETSERTGAGAGLMMESAAKASKPAKAEQTIQQTETHSFDLVESSNVPHESEPSWQRLIDGELELPTQSVAVKMLLQRVRQNISKSPSTSTRIKSAQLLRQYFVKNQGQHAADIALISGKPIQSITPEVDTFEAIASTPVVTQSSGIPAENNPVWLAVLSNQVQINTSSVALQMMLQRVRQSVDKDPVQASAMLQEFFYKHEKRLGREIQQLNAAASQASTSVQQAKPKAQTVNKGIPAEGADCWQQLIDGSLDLKTSIVALQMMLQRVRQSVDKNDSESSRMAGVKILRQYFQKHESAVQSEIRQLNSVSNVTSDEVIDDIDFDIDTGNIPDESHPNWQKLINGDLVLNTDTVALKMMLQSVRNLVQNNPSDSSRQSGARILRQYFVKHKNKHKTELDQLLTA